MIALVDSVDDKYEITWKIPNMIDNMELPSALPIGNNTQQVKKGDTVAILQMNEDIQEYYYYVINENTFTGLRMGNAVITFNYGDDSKHDPSIGTKVNIGILNNNWDSYKSKDGNLTIKDSDLISDVTLDKTGIQIAHGEHTIKMTTKGIDINCKGVISIKGMSGIVKLPGTNFFIGPPACPVTNVPLSSAVTNVPGNMEFI